LEKVNIMVINPSREALQVSTLDNHQASENGFNTVTDDLEAGQANRVSPKKTNVRQTRATPTKREVDSAQVLAARILDHHSAQGEHLMLGSDDRFWHYKGRVWTPVSEKWILGKIYQSIESNPVKGQKAAPLLGQVLILLKAKVSSKDKILKFGANPLPVINCSNGELWISEDGSVDLRPHRPESFLRHCLDVAYDPVARCPEYDRALRGIFSTAKRPDVMIRHWHELVGYIIQPRRQIPIIPILFGGGDNGKTKLMHTVIELLGPSLVHAQRIEDLGNGRFAMGNLFGRLLFIDDDVRTGARLPDGILKTISEAKEVTGEIKFGPVFNFIVRAVPVLLCNNVPSLADLSHGMLRRLMVIPFDRTFTAADKDPDLFERIWAKELPGVLNRAIEGYRRVVARGSTFKLPSAVKAATSRWLQYANPLPAFIEAGCLQDPEAECHLVDFYRAYSEWARAMGYAPIQNRQTVSLNLEHLGFAAKTGPRGTVLEGLAPIPSGGAS
jgi:putative DNA primase/helicase